MSNRTGAQRILGVVDGGNTHTVSASSAHSLREHAEKTLRRYFADLNGHDPKELYDMVLGEIERPLLTTLMEYTRGNQSRAAAILGLNRSTLRKKLRRYKINS
ncbi:MAG TPA: DNA-binding transcriptional regulator Fis [Gammaproteobacteria bacterium]|nr:DNA-binding transcriptional regulator Fis [Gammaproteobacteria bacterium]